jgi:hypothetical protein
MTRRTHEESIKYWGDLIREQQASGWSIRQFCDNRKILQGSFYKWRKQIAESASPDNHSGDSLMPVTVVNQPTKAHASPIEVRVDDSFSVLVRSGFDIDTLCQVVRALQFGNNGRPATC